MTHLSTLKLHRLRNGELDVEDVDDARAHLAECEICRGRLAAQERERAAFVLLPVPDALRGLREEPRRSWVRDVVPLLVAVAVAALLFVLVPVIRTATTAPETQDTVRFRGELPTIEVWVDRGQGTRALRPGEGVRAGDRVQLQYDPRGASAVAIAGSDGTGEIQVFTTNAPTGIGLVRMPFALTLDDAPGPQELFVIGSDAPLREAQVKAAVTRGVPGARVAKVALPKER